MLCQIRLCVEEWPWVAAFGCAMEQIMDERVGSARSHVGVLREVPFALEKRVWVAPFSRAAPKIITNGIKSRARKVRKLGEVPGTVEQTRSFDQLAICPLLRAPSEAIGNPSA